VSFSLQPDGPLSLSRKTLGDTALLMICRPAWSHDAAEETVRLVFPAFLLS
jgi:hypothetical protein